MNTCPYQGSRTIRTEEAVLISLATLSNALANAGLDKAKVDEEPLTVEFSDDEPSDESTENGEDNSENEGEKTKEIEDGGVPEDEEESESSESSQ